MPSRLSMALTLLIISAAARAGEPSADDLKFFESKIRPLLIESCFKCHSVTEKKKKGGLYVDSLDALLSGGETGPALVPGKPEASKLVEAVTYKNPDLQMPPKGKLSDTQVADLAEWVKRGAPWPKDVQVAAAKPVAETPELIEKKKRMADHWAWKPVSSSLPPKVKEKKWVSNEIDAFILAKLEEKKLKPAALADKRTLIRRATLDLIGLPPTPEEVDAFVNDKSKDAFRKVVDRLLASPHYGERWGRHWLDVARYADSNGMDENHAYANAYRYRDYVVESFNKDKPYDQFVREQLAGDLMPVKDDHEETLRRQIATGFLAIGPKVLAEPDPKKMEMDIIDEQLDTTGRAFMALTFGCCRCHDHKFDPLPTADYYSLAAIFKSTRVMENFKKVARWYERPLATSTEIAAREQHEAQIKKKKGELDALLKGKDEKKLAKDDPELAAKVKALRDEMSALEKSRPTLAEAMGATEGEKLAMLKIHIRGNPQTLGDAVPKRFPAVIAGTTQSPLGDQQSGRVEFANWLTRADNPLTSRVMANRIWRWHFGSGIVNTPDNFGLLGEKPSHPELLDFLATEFVRSGWSVKHMHRLIMLSSTYQQSVTTNEKYALADPENRLYWRMNRRRLEAEVLRDSALALSGELDLKIGGSLLDQKNRDYINNDKILPLYNSNRRSIYLPVIRNSVFDVFQAFDFPDPNVINGNRATTTVAPQALFMMNGKLVLDQSLKLGQWLLKQSDLDDAGRVRVAYEKAFSRPATKDEIARALDFLREYSDALAKLPKPPAADDIPARAWQGLCQVILASNEFVYVD